MAYATQDDLVPLRMTHDELVQLTDDTTSDLEPLAGQINAAIVTAALTEASGRIDAYCRQRYVTPLQASETIKGLCLDITIYLLFTRRRTTKPNETVNLNYQAAIKFLEAISTGKASLDQAASATQPQVSSGGATVTTIPQRFNDCNLQGWD